MCLWALARLEFLFLHVWTNVFGKKVIIFSLFPTTLLATWKGKDTNLCHLERVELLFMLCRPMFGKTVTIFSLFPTTLLATWKGKDTLLCHLERLELLYMQYRPMFGKVVTFFLSFQLLCWQPGKERTHFYVTWKG